MLLGGRNDFRRYLELPELGGKEEEQQDIKLPYCIMTIETLSSLKPTNLLALALTAIASPVANPAADEPNTLVARAAIKDVDCDGTKFTTTDIRNAINQAYTDAGSYPKAYRNGEGFFSSTTQLYEYLWSREPIPKGGDPGKYRVIMNEK
ncbi:hypothetical protein AbraIFM66950_005606 [Aspergillus brasiliensis]|nr:hypothetical protein AbraIFM66950_005606 [Aspergillus brasiliensis]